ncbi:MAG: TIGR03862 family flavoprotein [Nitrobacter sp.]|uniref:TIGR03862 family flavoprotein n=1 Tax=Nitrobacter sp. TaxID=29420 RepID=UPI00262D2971|nr:TIGR03862 family flavoprotein [Nitrobacter sp.]MCV0385134.1 TIGR03862 family flavoprotein [Nitrobacter sp.]
MRDVLHIRAAVLGAGPAGLMAAEVLARGGVRVIVFDAMPSAGRKFLMAGRGGLNLTHSEPLPQFLARYGGAASHLQPAIDSFTPEALRKWAHDLDQPTFVGSSGRVFPKALKASPLLRAWLKRLDSHGVTLALRHRWIGWDHDGRLRFQTPDGERMVVADATIMALGGASWPRLGSDGAWVEQLASRGIATSPLRPANCAFTVAWSATFRDRFEGQPLKNVALSFGPRTVRGEALITRDGIEGGGIYALSAVLREHINAAGNAILHVDLRPDVPTDRLAARLNAPRGKQSVCNSIRKVGGLSPVAIGLLQEAAIASGQQPGMMPPPALAGFIKSIPVTLTGIAPIARAISTAGGVAFSALDEDYMIRRLPGVFAAGEMLDWEAPTGGYLLQASFATGAAAGRGALKWLRR